MSTDRDDQADPANEVRYPSPGAEALDAGPFYHTTGRDTTHDPQHEHHPDHQHVDDVTDHVQVKDQGQPEMHHNPDPSTPHQHSNRPPNLEELQLAAQLGDGLAGTSMMPATDPNMNIDEHSLRNMMPPPDPDQQHTPSYIQDTPTSDGMVPHGLSVGPALPAHYSLGDGIPPRKRSKVSRACDECRRKKIKCDAQSDTGEAPCSSCARSSTRCLFSRVPQKRGPSKGYIKELADRIHSIENKLESEGGLSHEDLSGLFAPERTRNLNLSTDSNKKRPYSSISGGDFNASPPPGRQAPWGSEPRTLQPESTPDESAALTYNPESLAPQPSGLETDHLPKVATDTSMDIAMPEPDASPELTEGMLQDYLATVQTLYPILPSTKLRLDQLLEACPTVIRTAFINALLAVVQSSSGMVKLASSLLHEWESDSSPRTPAINIIHISALLLLVIDADWRCSSTVSPLLARAVALANTMGLWKYPSTLSTSEVDTDDNLCVRIWWSLVVIDRWHAVGTGQPVLIPLHSVVGPVGLEPIVGDDCFYLARLSRVLSRVSSVMTTLQLTSTTAESLNVGVLTDLVEIFREDLPTRIEPDSNPLVHLSYWHCRLLIVLLTPGATASELLWPLRELVDMLSRNSELRSPLTNHFTSLLTFASAKLTNIDTCRDEAIQLSKEMLEKQGGVWDIVRDRLSDQVRLATLDDVASLQRLADLATSHQSVANGGNDHGAGSSLSNGYLQLS